MSCIRSWLCQDLHVHLLGISKKDNNSYGDLMIAANRHDSHFGALPPKCLAMLLSLVVCDRWYALPLAGADKAPERASWRGCGLGGSRRAAWRGAVACIVFWLLAGLGAECSGYHLTWQSYLSMLSVISTAVQLVQYACDAARATWKSYLPKRVTIVHRTDTCRKMFVALIWRLPIRETSGVNWAHSACMEFNAPFFAKVLANNKSINPSFTPGYDPQLNGTAERSVGLVKAWS